MPGIYIPVPGYVRILLLTIWNFTEGESVGKKNDDSSFGYTKPKESG